MPHRNNVPLSVLEAATRTAYEAKIQPTGAIPWTERSERDQGRYRDLIVAAVAALPALGYAVVPVDATLSGELPREHDAVLLSRADADALWAAISRDSGPAEDRLRAFTAFQRALTSGNRRTQDAGHR